MSTVNVVVETDGELRFIYHDELAGLLELGPSSTVRASHVEPHATGGWAADMGPSGGPVLLDNGRGFTTRAAALDAEVAWLREHRGL